MFFLNIFTRCFEDMSVEMLGAHQTCQEHMDRGLGSGGSSPRGLELGSGR